MGRATLSSPDWSHSDCPDVRWDRHRPKSRPLSFQRHGTPVRMDSISQPYARVDRHKRLVILRKALHIWSIDLAFRPLRLLTENRHPAGRLAGALPSIGTSLSPRAVGVDHRCVHANDPRG